MKPRNEYWLLSEAEPARRWRANAPAQDLARALVAYRQRQREAGRRRDGGGVERMLYPDPGSGEPGSGEDGQRPTPPLATALPPTSGPRPKPPAPKENAVQPPPRQRAEQRGGAAEPAAGKAGTGSGGDESSE